MFNLSTAPYLFFFPLAIYYCCCCIFLILKHKRFFSLCEKVKDRVHIIEKMSNDMFRDITIII